MMDAYVLFMPRLQSLSIHQQHHCHSSLYYPLLLILITTAHNSLSGTIPTEIGQLTELTDLLLRKYDGCLRFFHALFFIFKLTTGSAVSSILFRGTEDNDLTGEIPRQVFERKYDRCLRFFHALFFIYKLTTASAVSSILFRGTDFNDLTEQILARCYLSECRAAFSPPSPVYHACRVFLIRLPS
jgi:hypothetical protein